MSNVKCVKAYYDTQLNRHVDIDELLNVSDERANRLIKAKVCVEVEATTPTTENVAKGRGRKKECTNK